MGTLKSRGNLPPILIHQQTPFLLTKKTYASLHLSKSKYVILIIPKRPRPLYHNYIYEKGSLHPASSSSDAYHQENCPVVQEPLYQCPLV